MIIVDLSQVMLSNLMKQLDGHTNATLEENMLRHMVLNSLRSYKVKFGNEYGEMVIACDSTNYWRKKMFEPYKANRKAINEKSELDWKAIYAFFAKIRVELAEFSPYRIIEVETAEADDIIGTLVRMNATINHKTLILSGDKDFIQLHKYPNVKQYDPTRAKWIAHDNPSLFLREHILKGDAGDGVPNILSKDDCFVIGERQRSMTAKRLEYYMNTDVSEFDTMAQRNFHRNAQLIDLDNTPEFIRQKVKESYDAQTGKDRSKLLRYFMDNRMKHLIECISDF